MKGRRARWLRGLDLGATRLGNHRVQDQRVGISLAHGGQLRLATFSPDVCFLSLDNSPLASATFGLKG